MPHLIACPSQQHLQRLLLGQVPDAEAEGLEQHLAECALCARIASTLKAEDTLAQVVRSQGTLSEGPVSPVVEGLMQRLEKLRLAAPADSCATDGAAGDEGRSSEEATLPPRPAAAPSHADNTEAIYDFLAPGQAPDELGRLGGYRVLKVLGAGGMGVVFQAEDPQLQRLVALKAMLPALAAGASAKQRFVREARAAAALKHDHIVTIHQVGEDRGVPFLAMEFLEGESLDDRLKRKEKLAMSEATRVGREIAEGLAAAHERGLIHRDIKPGNVWLEGKRARVKVLDFGLVRAAGEESHLTREGAIMGTPAYMAPEQASGQPIDARCDLFSLGCVLYRMTTGRPPFSGTDAISTLMAVALEQPPAPGQLNPEVPPALSALVMRLLAKNPTERPASAETVVKALREIEDGQAAPVTARPKPVPPRRRWAAALAGIALLAVAAALTAAVVIRITSKNGDVTELKAPPGAVVEVMKDGKVVDKLTADAEPPPEPAAPGAVLADAPKPFVLTHKGGDKPEAFQHFASAILSLQDGDAIEVHGNGPFHVDAVVVKDKGFTLRAAPGYRPQFVVPAAGFNFQGGPLLIEGCDFRYASWRGSLFAGGGALWEIRNCRLLNCLYLGGVIDYSGPKLRLSDCLLCTSDHAITLGPKAELDLENNLFRTGAKETPYGGYVVAPDAGGGQTIRCRRNTFLGTFLAVDPSHPMSAPIAVEAAGNVFGRMILVRGGSEARETADRVKDWFHWQGRDNLYFEPKVAPVGAGDDWQGGGLADWNKLWGKEEEGSRETAHARFQWEEFNQDEAAAFKALRGVTEDVRNRYGKDMADLGPDWDLVGPGDAYVKALAAQGKAAAKEPLRPEPPPDGPFVILHEGKMTRGCLNLKDAVAATADGDTIEVRSDEPFEGGRFDGGAKRLTLRAAAGYRPVQTGSAKWLLGALTVEGICFRRRGARDFGLRLDRGTRMRLANCSLQGGELGELGNQGGEGVYDEFTLWEGPGCKEPPEIVNCLITGSVSFPLKPGQRFVCRNSVVGAVSYTGPEEGEGRLELERSVVWAPFVGISALVGSGGKAAVSARNTLFEAGSSLFGQDNTPPARWSGSHNVYRIGLRCWWSRPSGQQSDADGLDSLRRRWDSPEEGSVEADPADYDPLQWRLLPSSPGYRTGPDKKDFGADVDRVAHTAAPTKP